VTTLNNIMSLIAPAPQKPVQAQDANQKDTALQDFLGMILSPANAGTVEQTPQLSPKDMQALTEKIAALLNQNPADMPLTVQTNVQGGLSASLTQDLSAALAAQLQEAAPQAMTEALPEDITALADLLNNIEPGSGNTELSAEETAKLQAFLQAQKTAQNTVQNAAQDSTAQIPAKTSLQSLLQAQTQVQTDQTAEAKTQAAAAQYAPHAHDSDDAPLPANMQPQQPATPAKTDGASLPAAQIQAPAQTSSTGMGFGSGDFGQNGFTFQNTGDDVTLTGAGSGTGVDGAGKSFAQYTGNATASLPPQTAQMIAVQMQRNMNAKIDTFTLQLDPADLGRLDIELKFHKDGSMKAHLSAERPETLAMLQKDSAHLERVLQQAGIDVDGESLSFDLRQQAQNDDAQGTDGKRNIQAGAGNTTDNNTTLTNAADVTLNGYISERGVNIMV